MLPVGWGANVMSREPSVLMRAKCGSVVGVAEPLGRNVTKAPPARIFPSDWTAIAVTCPSGVGLNEASIEPSVFNRTRRLCTAPLTVVKLPPTRICPFD